jgi:hypothetical protein
VVGRPVPLPADELDPEPLDAPVPAVEPVFELLPVVPCDALVASLPKTISPAACTPLADGSLTVITQCEMPALFCAAVGGQ